VDYPSNWTVQAAEVQHSYGTDTTIVSPDDPNTLLRVDVQASSTISSPGAAAQPVIDTLEQDPGYQLLDLSTTTFDGYSALHWEFRVDKGTVLVQEEDVFFIDSDNDDSVAMLTEAPADVYAANASLFAAIRQTLAMN